MLKIQLMDTFIWAKNDVNTFELLNIFMLMISFNLTSPWVLYIIHQS